MADPVVTLETPRLTVEPGGQASTSITIRNTGTIVENYRVEVLFDNGTLAWAEVLPPEVPVYPQQQGSAVVVFSPPPGPQAPGGNVPFAVRAVSVVDPAASAVVEGDLEIGRIHGLQAKLAPVTSSGRWRARHVITVTNWGNAPARLRWTPADPDQKLGFLVRPEVVDVPLGGSATARLKVRTRSPVLRGTPMRLPFQVVGEPDMPSPVFGQPPPPYSDPGRPVVDGAFTQKPILSRGVVGAGALIAVGLIALGVFAAMSGKKEVAGLDENGTPLTPTKVSVEAVSPTQLAISWQAMRDIGSYKLLWIRPDDSGSTFQVTEGIAGEQDSLDIPKLRPGTEYCFRLEAVSKGQDGPPSKKVCRKTEPAPKASESQGGGSGTDGNGPVGQMTVGSWVGIVDSAQVEKAARDWLKDLQGQGFKGVKILDTNKQQLVVVTTPSWVVYVGPFATEDEAREKCQPVAEAHGFSCRTSQVGPPTASPSPASTPTPTSSPAA